MTKVNVVDNAHINIDFGNGVYAVITTGFTIQAYRTPAVELYGSEGTIQMLGDDWHPKGYELYREYSEMKREKEERAAASECRSE